MHRRAKLLCKSFQKLVVDIVILHEASGEGAKTGRNDCTIEVTKNESTVVSKAVSEFPNARSILLMTDSSDAQSSSENSEENSIQRCEVSDPGLSTGIQRDSIN